MSISVARALQELKRTDDKINRAIHQGQFIGLMIGGKDANGSASTKDELCSSYKASLDKVNDLIKHRASVKAAIVQSNATTKVTLPIFGETTVAQAIEYKSMIHSQTMLVDNLIKQHNAVMTKANQQESHNEQRVTQLVESSLGSDVKKTGDEYESIAKPYMERYKVEVIDPIKVKDFVERKREEIEDFVSNIDYILSESNAVTMIDV